MNTFKFSNRVLSSYRLKHRDTEAPGKSELYVGPTTYCRFMDTFKRIYAQRAQQRTEKVSRLK